jgi:hypothetical protein
MQNPPGEMGISRRQFFWIGRRIGLDKISGGDGFLTAKRLISSPHFGSLLPDFGAGIRAKLPQNRGVYALYPINL